MSMNSKAKSINIHSNLADRLQEIVDQLRGRNCDDLATEICHAVDYLRGPVPVRQGSAIRITQGGRSTLDWCFLGQDSLGVKTVEVYLRRYGTFIHWAKYPDQMNTTSDREKCKEHLTAIADDLRIRGEHNAGDALKEVLKSLDSDIAIIDADAGDMDEHAPQNCLVWFEDPHIPDALWRLHSSEKPTSDWGANYVFRPATEHYTPRLYRWRKLPPPSQNKATPVGGPTTLLDEMPLWLGFLLAPVMFVFAPIIIMCAGFLMIPVSGAMKLFGASKETLDDAADKVLLLAVPIVLLAMLLAAFASNSGSSFSGGSSGAATLPTTSYGASSGIQAPIGDDVRVRGYTRGDDVNVRPHFRTRANDTEADNYSTYPNINPYTGERGYRRP